MDCLRSFTQNVDLGGLSLLSLNPTISAWGSAGAYHISAIGTFSAGFGVCSFLPQGFKNIDVYGIKVTGLIISDPANLTDGAIIQNWGLAINLTGTYAQLSGVYGNQSQTINQNPQSIFLDRYSPEITFPSPIKSLNNVSIQNIFIQANAGQINTDIALTGGIQLTTYYKFEGE
jgi:hypothetical protein